MQDVKQLAQWIREANSVVVLTGAGMSTESGIPDFRSKNGWWRGVDPSTVATIDALTNDYSLFHEFYSMRLETLKAVAPHEGHIALANLQRKGFIDCIATQNVDNLHQRAGAETVHELHGNINHIRCQSCGQQYEEERFLQKEACQCGGKLRPGIVLFGEFLPEDAWNKAYSAIRSADVVIVIGTSLQVAPVNQLPKMTKGKKVYINLDIFTETKFDLMIAGTAKATLVALEKELLEDENKSEFVV